MRLILISALQIERTVLFSTAIIVAAFIPLFTMQGVEGQIFGPMAKTYASALIGALIATFTVHTLSGLPAVAPAYRGGGNLHRARAALGASGRS